MNKMEKNKKKDNEEIKFVDTREKKFISTKETTKRVIEYIDECGKDSLKRESALE